MQTSSISEPFSLAEHIADGLHKPESNIGLMDKLAELAFGRASNHNGRVSHSKPEVIRGSVASLHLHPAVGGEPLTSVTFIEVVEAMGVRGEPRYFGRRSLVGQPTTRQVSLIEREQIAEHSAMLGVEAISPGAVRANIETFGIKLVPLVGQSIQIGSAVLHITKPRDPCEKMDRICRGLRKLMEHDKQGVLARVIRSGVIRVGDHITLETVLQR